MDDGSGGAPDDDGAAPAIGAGSLPRQNADSGLVLSFLCHSNLNVH